MKTKKSGAKYSAIVKIGEDLKEQSRISGEEFLYLNRGINQVKNIDLNEIISSIDFNSGALQYYPNSKGLISLRQAINKEFFGGNSSEEKILVTAGGVHALYLLFQTLDVKEVYTQSFFWGAYANIFKITGKEHLFYDDFDDIINDPEKYRNSSLIICDPNNPTGSKTNDDKLIEVLDVLDKYNTTIIWDGPYRRLFFDSDDTLYQRLLNYENLIITESFSKSIGLSGQRVGFMHCKYAKFLDEFSVHLLYSSNGINAFAQHLVEKILTTPEGKKAASEFKKKTTEDIKENIAFLKERGILAEEFYKGQTPLGIFVIVNKSFDELKANKIGSVPLNYFTKREDIDVEKYARICVSVSKDKFRAFFGNL